MSPVQCLAPGHDVHQIVGREVHVRALVKVQDQLVEVDGSGCPDLDGIGPAVLFRGAFLDAAHHRHGGLEERRLDVCIEQNPRQSSHFSQRVSDLLNSWTASGRRWGSCPLPDRLEAIPSSGALHPCRTMTPALCHTGSLNEQIDELAGRIRDADDVARTQVGIKLRIVVQHQLGQVDLGNVPRLPFRVHAADRCPPDREHPSGHLRRDEEFGQGALLTDLGGLDRLIPHHKVHSPTGRGGDVDNVAVHEDAVLTQVVLQHQFLEVWRRNHSGFRRLPGLPWHGPSDRGLAEREHLRRNAGAKEKFLDARLFAERDGHGGRLADHDIDRSVLTRRDADDVTVLEHAVQAQVVFHHQLVEVYTGDFLRLGRPVLLPGFCPCDRCAAG